MAELNPVRRFAGLPNDSRIKTLGVAFLVALSCATAVSLTAVTLRPVQQANLQREREARMAELIAALPGMADILRETGADTLDTAIVDLSSGTIAEGIDPAEFDYAAVQTDPAETEPLAPEEDIAGIGRRPKHAPIYLLRDDERLVLAVLPVYGAGYQSTIRAYLALEGDLNTIAGLSIYEQGDTPGIGSRITDPAWLERWQGMPIADESGAIAIAVVKGASGPFEIDAVSGATRSSLGVSNLVRFWLGDRGFGPFLEGLRSEGG